MTVLKKCSACDTLMSLSWECPACRNSLRAGENYATLMEVAEAAEEFLLTHNQATTKRLESALDKLRKAGEAK